MADTHETIADIIAWLRKPREGENAYLTLWRDEIADRLEAAHKRELSKNTSKNGADFGQLGDAAKLREALKLCCSQMCKFCKEKELARSMLNKSVFGVYCHPTECKAFCAVSAALSAPPRNCDLPEVAKGQPKLAEQAWRVFKRSHKDSRLDAYGLLRCITWLLTPATEKEGGDDGNT